MHKLLMAAVAAAVAVAGFAVFASAGEGPQGTSLEFDFLKKTGKVEKRKNKPVGSDTDLEPAKRDTKGTDDTSDDTFTAPAKTVIKFHAGSNVDTAAVARCKKDPSKVQTGEEKCPNKTKVGEGQANAVIGQSGDEPGTPLVSTVEAFNRKNELLLVVTPCSPGTGPGTETPCALFGGSRVVLIGEWTKPNTRPTLTVETPPALLRGGVIITRFQLETELIAGNRGSFVTSPDVCPASGQWKTQAIETYEDGSKAKINDTTPCNA